MPDPRDFLPPPPWEVPEIIGTTVWLARRRIRITDSGREYLSRLDMRPKAELSTKETRDGHVLWLFAQEPVPEEAVIEATWAAFRDRVRITQLREVISNLLVTGYLEEEYQAWGKL